MKQLIILLLSLWPTTAAFGQPNIVFVFSDDLSFRDLSAYGQKNFPTPHIDELIRTSTRFTQAYAGAPECAPSRGTLLTGLHVGHQPIRLNQSARGFEYLPDSCFTFAEMLKQAGYITGVIGKWGLGYHNTEGRPLNQGFDYHYGFLTHYEAHSYFPLVLYENDQVIQLRQNADMKMGPLYQKARKQVKAVAEDYYDVNGKLTYMNLDRAAYVPDLLDEKAAKFIHHNKEQPFLLFYTTNLPHGPVIVDDLRALTDRKNMDLVSREWGAMVQRLDQSVGRIVAELRAAGVYENTVILFASDNGYSMHSPSKNTAGERIWRDDPDLLNKGPFHGGKFGVREGGMRIPFFLHLPEQSSARVFSQPVWLIDVFPTLAELAGIDPPPHLDGYSLLPIAKGEASKIPLDRILYFYKQNEQAIRQGPWFAFRSSPGNPVELFLLEEDQKCEIDLAPHYPRVAGRMERIMDTIHEPSEWYWNPGDSAGSFEAKRARAKALGQTIKAYRPNEMVLMPWEKK